MAKTGMCYQLEHPRASTTDDVECLFSMMHDSIGQKLYHQGSEVWDEENCL